MKFSKENVIAYALAFVVIWFGINEIVDTKNWVGFVPQFLGVGSLAYAAVISHGIVLSITGLMLTFNFHRRIAAGILVLVFTELIIDLIIGGISKDIIVRDIGLWGMAIALTIKEPSISIKS